MARIPLLTPMAMGLLFLLAPFAAKATEPTMPSSNGSKHIVNCNQVQLAWTPGNGTSRLIVMRAGQPVSELPADGQTYTANSTFGQGHHMGNGNYVVYNGSGNSALVTGMQPATMYHFAILEYNGSGIATNYLTSSYHSLNLPTPNAMVLNPELQHVSCYSYRDGQITLGLTGGSQPITFQWSNGATTQHLSGIPAGNYTVTVTDSGGCVLIGTYTITQPAAITWSISKTDIRCPGEETGDAAILVSGGSEPITYTWSNGGNTASIANLPAGLYRVTFTDANGCTYSDSVAIIQPPAWAVMAETEDARCYGESSGAISLNIAGATGPYQVAWPDGRNGTAITGLAAGSYTVTISDNRDCSTVRTWEIGQPDEITANLAVELVSCEGNDDGRITAHPKGGTAPYDYWWNTSSNASSIGPLAPGYYDVRITDARGCEAEATVLLEISDDPRGCLNYLVIYDIFTPNGDGRNDLWVIEGLEHFPNNEVTVYNRWGQPVYRQPNYQNNWVGTTSGGDALPAGTYFYVFTIYGKEPIEVSGPVTFLR